ncbi:MAG: WYL domain-containing protein [Ruminococcus sp.]|nr:WYL domain-containing protein [Ruminococcus sp.]
MKKIAALSGSHQAEILTENIIHFNTRKHTNEHIYYNVNTLEQCIRYKKKASFKYFDLDENRDKEYRKDGEKYTAEPVALVFNNDNYYLMTYDKTAENEIKNYRVDRMDSVEMLDNSISKKANAKIDKVSQYTGQVFRMYGGKTEKLSLVFSKKLIDQVYDKFGEKTDITKDGDCYSADVEVQISTTFWSWVAQFKGQMSVAGPKELAIEYEEWIKSIKN